MGAPLSALTFDSDGNAVAKKERKYWTKGSLNLLLFTHVYVEY